MAPPAGVPPPLPPSVEEAYRRKCIQLKQRMNEVEEANDASRQRLARLNRQIQKMRLERAFLLEQLAKRTSTNVEDSEGSPSPPPTPKEKPLRTKRGHRKPEFLSSLGDGSTGSAFIQQGPVTLSPSSDAFSHTHPDPSQTIRTSTPQAQTQTSKRQLPNGHKYAAPGQVPPKSSPERAPKNAFDLYCKDMRSVLAERHTKEIADGSFDIEGALARGWSALDEEGRGEFLRKFEQVKKAAEVEKEVAAGGGGAHQTLFDAGSRNADEDVEMAEEGDDVDMPSGEGGGFTAVNRG